ncbi:zinc metallopeptidase [Ornatilinea apprima]|uniref:Zinc metallopeptidase n=2 Tax=Ornatilinea apprima TaxID=1134406 RepID=A0A0P6XQ57_9CHLR|nr:zinc metallopeptidase [Ornatilinea apprima]
MFGGYGLYILFSLPALLLGMWAQAKVRSAFSKYSRVRSNVGMSGAEVARAMLDSNGLQNVRVEETRGMLSDHYDPTSRTLRLSSDVYRSNSIAAAGVAAHEAGHALQHKQGYFFLQFRSLMVPTVQLGSWLGPIIFMIGMFIQSTLGTQIATFGLILFAATAVFAFITLPVEFDATKRAKAWLSTSGVLYQSEMTGINSVLDAAALTYVAGAVQAVSTILYYLFLLSGRRSRR